MAAITLPEYAKSMDDPVKQAMVELFPETSDILRAMPFKNAPGGAYRYQEEGALGSTVAFRAINEEPTADYGVVNDLVEQCFPMAGNIDVDRALVRRNGPGHRAVLERMKVKEKTKLWTDTFMTGDNQSNPREFTGLKPRLRAVGSGAASVNGTNYESRVVANSTASGGGALSLAMLDIAIGLVEMPTHILMPKILMDRLPAATRDTGVSGFFTQDRDSLGRPVPRYNGLEILTGYGITPFGAFLPFDEVAYAGGSAVTSSIYIVSFREDGVCGIQTAPMEITDIGLTEGGTWLRTNVEHDTGMVIENRYSAIRLSSITNAAIVK